jgi:arylsulfatase A
MFTCLFWLRIFCGAAVSFAAALPLAAAPATAEHPNVILILVDDLGATDLGCFGSKFYQTPNIDRLAARGVKFTQAYSACTVCSPTRASLLTGQYPARLHITDWIEGHRRPFARLSPPDWRMQLPPEEMNLAKAFKSAGYATISIGKWHLGPTNCFPKEAGFDENIGGYNRGQPPSYFAPYKIPTMSEGPAGEYLTDREAAEAVKFIERNRAQRFFLYLPHYAVHTPIQSKTNVVAKYRALARAGGPQTNAAYAALVESVDDSLGQILAKLDETRLAENTVIIFTSDNGGLLPITRNLGLRAGKGSAYEGGVRVPLIVHWPGVTRADSTNATPVISPDLYPTLLELAGLRDAPGHIVDGESLVPLLRATGPMKRDALYWHYPHYHPGGATPYSAVRVGDFKLIQFHETDRAELYDLKNDPLEARDLAATQPERVSELRGKLESWRKKVGAQMPVANPAYDPARAVRWQ